MLNSLMRASNRDRIIAKAKAAQIDDCIEYRESDFVTSVERLVVALEHHGAFAQSNSILLFINDTYQFAIAFIALASLEKRIVLPQAGAIGSVVELLPDVDAALVDQDLYAKLDDYQRSLEDTKKPLPCFSIQKLLADSSQYESKLCLNPVTVEPDNVDIVIYTSGSTGQPKPIIKSLSCFVDEVGALELLWGEQVNDAEIFSTVSHQHVYGLLFRCLWPLLTKRVFWAQQVQFPEEMLVLLKPDIKAVVVSSPAFLSRVSDHGSDFGNAYICMIYSSGGPLKIEDNICAQKTLGAAIVEVFGSSETGGVAYRCIEGNELQQTWTTLPGVEIEKSTLSNCLLVKSPYVYQQGWFEMGDLVEIEGANRFRVKGRTGRVVKIEEKRISLDEIEQRLTEIEEIDAAKVIVLQGKRVIVAAVVILSAQGLSKLMMQGKHNFTRDLRGRLAHYLEAVTLPRKWRFVDAFPMNAQGKVTQANLAKLFD